MRLGANTATVRVGSSAVSKVYLGTLLAWEPSGGGLSWSADGVPEGVDVAWTGSNTFTATGGPEIVTVEWT